MADKTKKVKAANVSSGRYPHKKSLNLVVKEKSGINFLILIPVLLILFVGGLVFSKYMIIDRFAEVDRANAEVASLQNSQMALSAYLQDYPAVEEEYQRYSTKWMTSEELSAVLRTDMMDLMEEEFAEDYTVVDLSANGNILSMNILGATLNNVSGLIQKLYARDDVAKVEIASASKMEITRNMTEEELQEREDAKAAGTYEPPEDLEEGEEEGDTIKEVVDVVAVNITMKQVVKEDEAA